MSAGKSTLKLRKKRIEKMLAAGRVEQARLAVAHLCETAADDGDVWRLAGQVEAEMQNPRQAASCLERALELQPENPDTLRLLGASLLQLGRWRKAIDCLDRVLQQQSADHDVHAGLGIAWRNLGNPAESARHLRKAIELKPDATGLHLEYGTVLEQLGHYGEAAAAYRKAAELDPADERALERLGEALMNSGRLEAAEETFLALLERQPENTAATAGLIKTLDRQGRQDDLAALARRLSPGQLQRPAVAAALGRAAACLGDDPWLDGVLRRALAHAANKGHTTELAYQLGALQERQGRFEEAFGFFRMANEAQRPGPRHMDEFRAVFQGQIEGMMNEFPLSSPPQRAAAGGITPVFIVGMPRSGTSLVEQILASHPQVQAAGELTTLSDIAMALPEKLGTAAPFPCCAGRIDAAALDWAAGFYLERLPETQGDKTHVTDKMPQNFILLGLLHMIFPEAPIIHCRRQPLDTCVSIYCNHFPDWHAYATDLEVLGWYYGKYRALMRHWKEACAIPMLEVDYEDLVSRPEAVIRDMLSFCSLDWDERCLEFHRNRRYVNTLSYNQVRQPLHGKSVARWRSYESFLGPLMKALGEAGVETQA